MFGLAALGLAAAFYEVRSIIYFVLASSGTTTETNFSNVYSSNLVRYYFNESVAYFLTVVAILVPSINKLTSNLASSVPMSRKGPSIFLVKVGK